MANAAHIVLWFSDIEKSEILLVGSAGVALGEMVNAELPIPKGFIITSSAYHSFIRENNLSIKIKHLLSTANFDNTKSLDQVSGHIKKLILQGKISEALIREITSHYNLLGGALDSTLIEVTPSVTGYSANKDFIHQNEIIKGDALLLEKVKETWSFLFDTSLIASRHKQKIDEGKIGMAIIIQTKNNSEMLGYMHTRDNIEVFQAPKNKSKITDNQLKELTNIGKRIAAYYYLPQKVDWEIEKSKIYILQIRPLTENSIEIEEIQHQAREDLFLKGKSIFPGISSGPVRIVYSDKDINKILPGDIIIASKINPDSIFLLKAAAAIVIESFDNPKDLDLLKNLGIPIIILEKNPTEVFKNNAIVTVNGTNGEVYTGGFANIQNKKNNPVEKAKTVTKLYLDVIDPDLSEQISKENIDGVGLLRAEHMLTNIGIHPKKVIREDKKDDFVEKLSKDLSKLCQNFVESPVVYRSSNLKTNEYRSLSGGKSFESEELNSFIGYRGAFRYIHDPEVFRLELETIKNVRNKMGHKNLWLMIPFIRTVNELIEVKKIINSVGLERSNTFKIWVSIEIPSNVIMLEKFIEVGIDGISIDADNLTMLTLGTDKNNSELANEFNETNEVMLWSFERAIKTAVNYGITSSIYGESISVYPELIRKLVSWGITSLTVRKNAVELTRKNLIQAEKEYINR